MADEVGLVGLGEGAEAGDEGQGEGGVEEGEVEVEVVEGGEEVGGVQGWGGAVFEVVGFGAVGVGEVADVAVAVEEGGRGSISGACLDWLGFVLGGLGSFFFIGFGGMKWVLRRCEMGTGGI